LHAAEFIIFSMSKALVHKQKPRKLSMVNCVTFPRELRDAIPDHEPSAGRVLKLESVDAQASNTVEWGRRVQIKLRVCETGKLSGAFDVWVDIEADAAKALGETILGAVEQSGRLKPIRAWPTT
jgi:hypothetical protein